jgi:hypothetical protein
MMLSYFSSTVIIFIGFNSTFITIEQGQNLDQSQCRVSKHRSVARKATKGGFGNRQVQKGDELVFDINKIK